MRSQYFFAPLSRLGIIRPLVFLSNRPSLLLASIIFLALFFRLPNFSESIWFDELWSTSVKLSDVPTLLVTILVDDHPPFYSLFMFPWIHIFGDSELSIRMPPLIFGLLSILLIYYISLKLTDTSTALLSSLLMCLSPVHIWYSQEARPYSATLFFLLFSILSWYRLSYARTSTRIWFIVYGISLTFSVYSHYFIVVFVVLISFLTVSLEKKIRNLLLSLNISILLSFALFLAVKNIFGRFLRDLSHLRSFTIYEFFQLFFNWFLSGNALSAKASIFMFKLNMPLEDYMIVVGQLLVIPVFLKGLISLCDPRKISFHVIMYLFSLPMCLLTLNLVGFENTYIERSAIIVLPFFYLALARGFSGFKSGQIRITMVVILLIFNISTLIVFFMKGDKWTVYKPNPDWRSAAAYLSEEIEKNQVRWTAAFVTTRATALTYYNRHFREAREREIQNFSRNKMAYLEGLLGKESKIFTMIFSVVERHIKEIGELTNMAQLIIYYEGDEKIYQIMREHDEKIFYVLHNKYWSGGFEKLISKIMNDERYENTDKHTFKGLEIFKFSVKGDTYGSDITSTSN